jgi:methyl-accepting chemotaxis protein
MQAGDDARARDRMVAVTQQGGEEVESGIELAGRARQALGQVVGEAQGVVDRISHIAAATEEQSSASE